MIKIAKMIFTRNGASDGKKYKDQICWKLTISKIIYFRKSNGVPYIRTAATGRHIKSSASKNAYRCLVGVSTNGITHTLSWWWCNHKLKLIENLTLEMCIYYFSDLFKIVKRNGWVPCKLLYLQNFNKLDWSCLSHYSIQCP